MPEPRTRHGRASPRRRALRLILPAAGSVILVAVALFAVLLPSVRERLLDEKRRALRSLTEVAGSLLQHVHREVAAGTLTPAEARARVIAELRELRYGPRGKDYFWIVDDDLRMVMHPYRPELEGEDVSGYLDPEGTPVFVDMARVAARDGAGFVSYLWQWKDEPRRVAPKLSHVRLFEPWGWIVGTGLYVDDVHVQIGRLTRRIVYVALAAIALLALVGWFLVREGVRSDRARVRTESDLADSEARYRLLVESANTGIGVISSERPADGPRGAASSAAAGDAGPWLTYANRALLEGLGYAPADVPLPVARLLADTPTGRPMVLRNYERRLRGEVVPTHYEAQFRHADGRVLDIELSVTALPEGLGPGVLVLAEDISARKQAEAERERRSERLQESQKLEAIGRLAGGVAHDFNNLLAAIQGYGELLAVDEQLDGTGREAVREIVAAAGRAGDLTGQLLTFARRHPRRLAPLDPNEIVSSVARLLARSVDRRIRIEPSPRARGAAVLGDRNQLENALLNVALNARDAMPDGGTIRLACDDVTLGPDDAPDGLTLPPGRYARLIVTDTGVGMTPEVQARVFEPFFTTKAIGKGTGLGLASAYGCVREHDGDVAVDSAPGQGTTVTVYLPLLTEAATDALTESAELREAPGAWAGLRVLVVDDERSVLRMLERALSALGHDVATARSGEAALAWLADHAAACDVVLLDLVMPGLSGQETLAAIRARHVDVPVVVMSGWSVGLTRDDLQARGAADFLAKPFRLAGLASVFARFDRRDEGAGGPTTPASG